MAASDLEGDEGPSATGDILSTFRARRESRARDIARLAAADDSGTVVEEGPPEPPAAPPAGPAVPASPSPPAREPSASPAATEHPGPAAQPPPGASRASARGPASLVVPRREPGPLVPQAPNVGLAERLLADDFLARRGSPRLQVAGVAVSLAGLGLLLVDRRTAFLADAVPVLAGVPVLWIAVAVGLAGAAAAGLATVLPPAKRLRVRLAASQKEEWERIQRDRRRLRAVVAASLGAAAASLLAGAFAYGVVPPSWAPLAAALLAALAVGAGVTAIVSATRLAALRRAAVQTLILATLERRGFHAGGDPRVGPVLQELDRLLGQLPDAALRGFLSTGQADAYLELLEEAREEGRHGG